jgi:hypothetical protein
VTTYTTASQTGPAVSTTYPIGSYCEDYAWLSSNGGDLDQYNGRYCVTPEYPSGTYAYFVTVTSAGVAAFPYYIGIQYYGAPATANLIISGTGNTVVIGTNVTCNYSVTLPLELLAFEGFNEKNKNKLIWRTASEMNVSHFSIERSRDGLNFEELGKVAAKGKTHSIESYTFTDDSPFSRNYYRLKMVDNDGTHDVSKIISLTNNQLNTVLIFPSIAGNTINIRSQSSLNATIKINDLIGRTLICSVMDLAENEQKEVNIEPLAKGIYIVSVEANGLKSINKIIKE